MDSLKVVNISIHAPREGGDAGSDASVTAANIISIHAPREGGDQVADFLL